MRHILCELRVLRVKNAGPRAETMPIVNPRPNYYQISSRKTRNWEIEFTPRRLPLTSNRDGNCPLSVHSSRILQLLAQFFGIAYRCIAGMAAADVRRCAAVAGSTTGKQCR